MLGAASQLPRHASNRTPSTSSHTHPLLACRHANRFPCFPCSIPLCVYACPPAHHALKPAPGLLAAPRLLPSAGHAAPPQKLHSASVSPRKPFTPPPTPTPTPTYPRLPHNAQQCHFIRPLPTPVPHRQPFPPFPCDCSRPTGDLPCPSLDLPLPVPGLCVCLSLQLVQPVKARHSHRTPSHPKTPLMGRQAESQVK